MCNRRLEVQQLESGSPLLSCTGWIYDSGDEEDKNENRLLVSVFCIVLAGSAEYLLIEGKGTEAT